MKTKSTLFAAVAVMSMACEAGPKQAAPAAQSEPRVADPSAVAMDLAFITHLDADLPEQDVYIERENGSGEVFRVTRGDHDMSAPLYKTAIAVEHNPFDPKAIGPYPKGEPLGVTLEEWLAQRGRGRYTCEEGKGNIALEFSALIPDGLYTMWYVFAALPPTEPFSGNLDVPFGARDGSENSFVADAEGSARFDLQFSPCLQLTEDWTTSLIAINYHSNGKTYKASPGPFGIHAHVPLFVKLPRADEVKRERVAQR